jgi:hypothetical protein
VSAPATARFVTGNEWAFLDALRTVARRIVNDLARLPPGAVMAEAERQIDDAVSFMCRHVRHDGRLAAEAAIRQALLAYVRTMALH